MKTYKSNMPEITLKYKKGETKKVKICSSGDVIEIAKELFNTDTIEINEEVLIIYLNRNNTTIGWNRHTTGGMAGSIIDVKMILTIALQCGAHSLIMMHNHPSGNIQPSQADRNISQKLKNACQIMDIDLLDSIIVSPEYKYYSLADNAEL